MSSAHPEIKLLVACHKEVTDKSRGAHRFPLHVGKALNPEINLGITGDNEGENISVLNPAYCELTALYWAWKNLKDTDIIGLEHYRRFFTLSGSKIIQLLDRYDFIVPHTYPCKHNNYINLALILTHEDVIITMHELYLWFPDERRTIDRFFYYDNHYSVFNMFICRWERFDEYCGFIFPFLEKLEKKLQPSGYTRLQRRLGYIAEMVFGLWLKLKRYKVKHVRVVDSEGNKLTKSLPVRIHSNLSSQFFNLFGLKNFKSDMAARLSLEKEGLIQPAKKN